MLTKEKPTLKEKMQTFGPWIKWLVRKEYEEYKATSAYIEMLCPGPKTVRIEDSSIAKLEKLVKSTIIAEFGSRIERSKCFNLLVDSVMYKLQRDALENSPE